LQRTAELTRAPRELRSRGALSAGPKRWEIVAHACDDKLEEAFGFGQTLEVVLAEIAEDESSRKHIAEPVVCRLRDENLPAVTGRADACGSVHVEPEVFAGFTGRASSVDSHSDTHIEADGPGLRRKRPLSDACGRDCLGSSSEYRGNFVTRVP
jgi:hypothetical protein